MKIKNILSRISYLRKECAEIVGFNSIKSNKFCLLSKDERGEVSRHISEGEMMIALFVLRKIHFIYRLFKGYF